MDDTVYDPDSDPMILQVRVGYHGPKVKQLREMSTFTFRQTVLEDLGHFKMPRPKRESLSWTDKPNVVSLKWQTQISSQLHLHVRKSVSLSGLKEGLEKRKELMIQWVQVRMLPLPESDEEEEEAAADPQSCSVTRDEYPVTFDPRTQLSWRTHQTDDPLNLMSRPAPPTPSPSPPRRHSELPVLFSRPPPLPVGLQYTAVPPPQSTAPPQFAAPPPQQVAPPPPVMLSALHAELDREREMLGSLRAGLQRIMETFEEVAGPRAPTSNEPPTRPIWAGDPQLLLLQRLLELKDGNNRALRCQRSELIHQHNGHIAQIAALEASNAVGQRSDAGVQHDDEEAKLHTHDLAVAVDQLEAALTEERERRTALDAALVHERSELAREKGVREQAERLFSAAEQRSTDQTAAARAARQQLETALADEQRRSGSELATAHACIENLSNDLNGERTLGKTEREKAGTTIQALEAGVSRERELRIMAQAELKQEKESRVDALRNANRRQAEGTSAAQAARKRLEAALDEARRLEAELTSVRTAHQELTGDWENERQRKEVELASALDAIEALKAKMEDERHRGTNELVSAQATVRDLMADLEEERRQKRADVASAMATVEELTGALGDERRQREAELASAQTNIQDLTSTLENERRLKRVTIQELSSALEDERRMKEAELEAAQATIQQSLDDLTEARRRTEAAEWEAMVADRTLEDVERECREPFVVPALLAAMKKMSRMTREAMKSPPREARTNSAGESEGDLVTRPPVDSYLPKGKRRAGDDGTRDHNDDERPLKMPRLD